MPAPEDHQTRSDDPDAPPPPRRGRHGPRESAASDEINVLLSSSLANPQPDPALGGSSSWDLARIASMQAERSPPRGGSTVDVAVDLASNSGTRRMAEARSEAAPPVDWPGLLLRSYASAMTLGLAWLFWTGRVGPSTAPPAPAPIREAAKPRRRAAEPPAPPAATTAASRASVRPAPLGKPIIVGELEVTPLLVLRKTARLTRDLGEEFLVREHDDCLALTVRLKNLARGGEALRPIAAADLIDGEAFAIDAPNGPGFAMFALAPGSEWALEDQRFPEIEPGEAVDVVLMSEPLGFRRLSSGMTWRFRVATDPRRTMTEDLGVTFGPNDIP